MTLEKNTHNSLHYFLSHVCKSIRFSEALKVSNSMIDPKLFKVWFCFLLHLLLAIYFWVSTSKASRQGSLGWLGMGGDTEKRKCNYISGVLLAGNFTCTSQPPEKQHFPIGRKTSETRGIRKWSELVWLTKSWVGNGTLVCLFLNPWPFYHTHIPLRKKS